MLYIKCSLVTTTSVNLLNKIKVHMWFDQHLIIGKNILIHNLINQRFIDYLLTARYFVKQYGEHIHEKQIPPIPNQLVSMTTHLLSWEDHPVKLERDIDMCELETCCSLVPNSQFNNGYKFCSAFLVNSRSLFFFNSSDLKSTLTFCLCVVPASSKSQQKQAQTKDLNDMVTY